VNFVAHALVATWWSPEPPFVLGAMLPDLVNMLGTRMPSAVHPPVELGIRLHYRTDMVFHAAPTFQKLVAKARSRLDSLGLRRGSARAAAHVGVELLFDTVLARDPLVTRAVGAALRAGVERAAAWLWWSDTTAAERFDHLATALLGRDLTGRDGTAEAVAFRVARALAGRTLLELDLPSRQLVARWASEAEIEVRDASASLLEEVARGLERSAVAAE
jgi:acyl carrier protein phosphodiesterase